MLTQGQENFFLQIYNMLQLPFSVVNLSDQTLQDLFYLPYLFYCLLFGLGCVWEIAMWRYRNIWMPLLPSPSFAKIKYVRYPPSTKGPQISSFIEGWDDDDNRHTPKKLESSESKLCQFFSFSGKILANTIKTALHRCLSIWLPHTSFYRTFIKTFQCFA